MLSLESFPEQGVSNMRLQNNMRGVLLGGLLLVVGLLRLVGVVYAETPDRPPNIIFIIADDQDPDRFGFLNGKSLTPNIDRLANEGIYFSRAYVSSSVCSPSRYTCLTGQYASRCKEPEFTRDITPEGMTLVRWNIAIGENQWTLPKLLQRSGYVTGMVGKWHVGSVPRAPGKPLQPGADPADPAVIARLKANQQVACDTIRREGFDFVKHVYGGNPLDDRELIHAGLATHHMEWLTQAGLEFIEQNHDRPFFLYFAVTLPHWPSGIEALKSDPTLTPLGKIDQPITGVQPSRESVMQRCREAGIPEVLWDATWLDDGVGSLMAKLEELSIQDDTIIIYFNDHGAGPGKGTCYESGLITPTMVYGPGRVVPRTCDLMIQNIDFTPTILDLAGIEPPDEMVIDGKSFKPILEGSNEPIHESVYSEIGVTRAITRADGWKYLAYRVPPSLQRTLEERLADQEKELQKIFQSQPWTKQAGWGPDPQARYFHLAMAPGGAFMERLVFMKPVPFAPNYFDEDQLYNLKEDPLETTNLAKDPAYADKLAEMKADLKKYLDRLPGTFAELKPE